MKHSRTQRCEATIHLLAGPHAAPSSHHPAAPARPHNASAPPGSIGPAVVTAAAGRAAGAAGPASRPPPAAGGLTSPASASADPCCMCGASPMDVAYQAPCGHAGCWKCWLQQIAASFRCKVCKRELRQKQLTRKYFA